MAFNTITDLENFAFSNMTSLRTLDLSHNQIGNIHRNSFAGLGQLINLHLGFNSIKVIERSTFQDLSNLKWLDLDSNQLTTLTSGTFEELTSLTDLILRRNRISHIEVGAMRGLGRVTGISLTNNSIQELRKGMLDGLSSVSWMSLRRNPLSYIEPGTFDNTPEITYLGLLQTELDNLHPDMFRGLTKLERLSTDDNRLCCLFMSYNITCTEGTVTSLDSCHRLMPNQVLRIFMWILGFSALIGNSMVLVIRWRGRHERRNREQSFFITNLAVADWLMGVFMILIASADIYFGPYYYLRAPQWRSSPLCAFAGFLAVWSSESSVFFLAVITLDRFVCVLFPFSRFKFHSSSARISAAITWLSTAILSMTPLIVGIFVPNFYGLSDVCIGLPLSTESTAERIYVWSHATGSGSFVTSGMGSVQPAWIYSIALFLGVNLILFLFILVCYVIIFIKVKRSAKAIEGARHTHESSRDQEAKMAAKMAVIVGTDFCCWMPVIIMGILSQTGLVELPVALYAWCAVFILPINASLNPYLYTIVTYIGKQTTSNSDQTISTKM
ncbi:G-protein coupled receptor GRL101-like [Diadema antillarum]|uniref:G-protein coupled receptor GRL101-like n=1 Tax=Diadema antillarum TaxID=105358 RepID=UPI003A864AC9